MGWKGFLPITIGALLSAASPAAAETFTVIGTGDTTPGTQCLATQCPSIRAAVEAAAGTVDADTIVLGANEYQLSNGQLLLNTPVEIVGASARTTSIRGNANGFRVLEVPQGSTASVSRVTLRDGLATDATGGTFLPGGVVRNSGTLTLDRVQVSGGIASSGGGVANTGGTVTITRSLISGNQATIGGGDSGGLLNFNGGTMTVRHSTIAANTARVGGGFFSWGDVGTNVTTFEHVTVVGNTATASASGGLSRAATDTLRLRASIVYGNSFNGTPANCGATVVSEGANVEEGTDCDVTGPDDQQSANPGFVALALVDRGGDTDVFELSPDSAAIDIATGCAGTDQRGIARPQGLACDAGAFEVEQEPVVVEPTPTPTAQPSVEQPPVPTATPTPTATPEANRTVVVRTASGTVLVKRPGSSRYAAVDATQGVPLGSTVDTRKGAVVLTSIPKPGAPPESATFKDGIFKVTQSGGITTLTLTEKLAPCGSKRARTAAKKPKTRKLWGNGKGKFRTKGQYSAATVRGTEWLVQDSCAGTLTRVRQGVVAVRDDVKKKTILLRKGRSYTARPRR